MMRLPDAPWLHDPALLKTIDALRDNGDAPRIVGGAVRDALLGFAVADVDLATPLLPQQVTDRLEAAGIKAVPTGVDHGTITAVADGRTFEITTLRRDVSTDGRRATVEFSTDWREDAARRDFTINALYVDPDSLEIHDYFGGLADLQAHHIRFIGDATQRIAEDHLRILRLFRFHARFGKGAIDAEALSAASANANKLMALSRERIADELKKLLSVADPSASIRTMKDAGIFAAFLPEIVDDAATKIENLVERERTAGVASCATRRISALLPSDPQLVEKVAARLKLSNRMRADLVLLASGFDPSSSARQLAYSLGMENARSAVLLCFADEIWAGELASLDDWNLPVLPIKGGDLIAKGLTQGPAVARTLQAIERKWVEELFPPVERVEEIADQLVDEALRAAKNS